MNTPNPILYHLRFICTILLLALIEWRCKDAGVLIAGIALVVLTVMYGVQEEATTDFEYPLLYWTLAAIITLVIGAF